MIVLIEIAVALWAGSAVVVTSLFASAAPLRRRNDGGHGH